MNSCNHRAHFQLSYQPPYAWNELINFFTKRAIPEMELVEDDSYQRLIAHDELRGWFKARRSQNSDEIEIELQLNGSSRVSECTPRLKNIFDLDSDPITIESSLEKDKKLIPFLQQHKGLRIPGCWDGFELAIRAVVGQKISVKGARTILSRIVEICGEKQTLDESLKVARFFPTPENILAADLSKIGLPASRIETLKILAHATSNKTLILDGTADFEDTCRKLLSIRGIGPWTVEYISMRALRNPNAFPETDLDLQKKISRLHLNPQKWVPWRAYGALLLWNLHLDGKT